MTDTEKKPGRGRKPAPEGERKDRVIQTRVPKELESSLKDAARRERVPVSQLIRNVLVDSFDLVENVVSDSTRLVENVTRDARQIAESAAGARKAQQPFVPAREGGEAARQLLEAVDAWQDVIVNKPGHCVQCGIELKRGKRAFRGLTTDPAGPVVWLCPDCIENL